MWFLALILHALYFISPAYCANSFAVFGGGKPLDFKKTFRGKRILGDGKTWRGLIIGLIAGTLFGLMWYLISQSGPLSETYYEVFDFMIKEPFFGFYLAAGALFGDIVASFFKRQMGYGRGAPMWGVDQLDFIFGALLFAFLFVQDKIIIEEAIAIIIITPAIHLIGNQIAYLMKRKTVRW